MDITALRSYVAVASEGDLARAARRLRVSQASVRTSLDLVEATMGSALMERESTPIRLTDAGRLFLITAEAEIAAFDDERAPAPVNAGGKAKASKGKGRAPRVKGEPLPYKKRQSR